MNDAAAASAEIADVLRIEELDTDLCRSQPTLGVSGRVFGGQVIAQALTAAARSVESEKVAHSLHAYFLRAGDPARPILYRVARDFDGGSFANRRVVAMQGGKAILNLTASFHLPEEGLSHQARMPEASDPETCPTMEQVLSGQGASVPNFLRSRFAAFDLRLGSAEYDRNTGTAVQSGWLRIPEDFAGDATGPRVALAYVSDFGLISTAMVAHDLYFFSPQIQGASLDHVVWFHRTPPIGEWLLYTMTSPWSGSARGVAHGSIYDRAGARIASVAQEGLIRNRNLKATS
nr:acyl-CoA thioesterase II [Novosphingobium aquimarinum]